MANAQGDEDAAASYAARHFGSPTAHPRVTHHYARPRTAGSAVAVNSVEAMAQASPRWTEVTGMRLTAAAARAWLAEGVTMVRIRHRLRRIDVPLSRYLAG